MDRKKPNKAFLIYRWLRKIGSKISGYYPEFPEFNKEILFSELASLLDIQKEEVVNHWKNYVDTLKPYNYSEKYNEDWEKKHLSSEEAFALYCILKKSPEKIKTVVEVGTQFGKSTRRIIDIKNKLDLSIPIYAFDIVDSVKYFKKDEEATLVLQDLTDTFKVDVLDKYPPGLIYLDAHPYNLVKNILKETILDGRWALAIHDCGNGMCNPKMRIAKDCDVRSITSMTGMWERYVLAEIFNIKNPKDTKLNNITGANYKFRVLGTRHGLAVLIPNHLKTT